MKKCFKGILFIFLYCIVWMIPISVLVLLIDIIYLPLKKEFQYSDSGNWCGIFFKCDNQGLNTLYHHLTNDVLLVNINWDQIAEHLYFGIKLTVFIIFMANVMDYLEKK